MRVIRGRRNITESDKGCVVTIGNFDGVHLGHQAILAAVKSQATKDGVDSMLVCFEPQPKEFFDEFKAPARLPSCERRVLVPYDKDGQPIVEGQPRMWWDLRDRAQVRVCPENNIQRSNQTAFMHIGGKDRVNKHGRKFKAGPGIGVVLKREARACCIQLDIEAVTMKLGLWWLDAAQRGAVQRLPVVNQNPEFE